MDPVQLAADALAWLGITPGGDDPDTAAAALVAPAVASWTASLPHIDGDWPDPVRLGAVMLTARLIRRRNSPAGIEAFTGDGAAYVRRTDPDITALLRLNYPQVG